MSKLTEALKTVIAHLDEKMEQGPDRQTADVTNYLQTELEGLE